METKQKGSPFSQLPKEKKKRILQAAIEVFAQNDYKHASTDEIASRAGISKGLLFYYFHDKKTLYFYLGEYLKRMIENHLKKEVLMGIDDFFDLLDYGIEGKLKLFEKMPWVLEFSVRMYYNTEKDISPVTKKYIVSMTNQMYDLYFSHVDTSRFREGVSPKEVLQTLIFLTDGYLHWQLTVHEFAAGLPGGLLHQAGQQAGFLHAALAHFLAHPGRLTPVAFAMPVER